MFVSDGESRTKSQKPEQKSARFTATQSHSGPSRRRVPIRFWNVCATTARGYRRDAFNEYGRRHNVLIAFSVPGDDEKRETCDSEMSIAKRKFNEMTMVTLLPTIYGGNVEKIF